MNSLNIIKFITFLMILLQASKLEGTILEGAISVEIKEIINFDSSQYLIITKDKENKTIKFLSDKNQCHCSSKSKLQIGKTYILQREKLSTYTHNGFLVNHIVFIDGRKILEKDEDVYRAKNLLGLCFRKPHWRERLARAK
ncbi:MAG: hypothetical protein KF706_03470 [Chitinophagales bacterium]|nr:hypothetical protein [Chitinophagales bacterium]